MNSPYWLSRVHLRDELEVSALRKILPKKEQWRLGGHYPARAPARVRNTVSREAINHTLIWSLFKDDRDERNHKRDFLYRQDSANARTFYILSARKPEDDVGIFKIDEPKTFQPVLQNGQQLHFMLRCNPVVANKYGRHDVVMNALNSTPANKGRAEMRPQLIWEAGCDWLTKLSQRKENSPGFHIADKKYIRIDGYYQHCIPRKKAAKDMQFHTLDFEGKLTVDNPEQFVSAICKGFGKAKAFGCGLMLIRRAI